MNCISWDVISTRMVRPSLSRWRHTPELKTLGGVSRTESMTACASSGGRMSSSVIARNSARE